MTSVKPFAVVLALGAFAALPSCSMLNMHRGGAQTSSASTPAQPAMGQPAMSADMVKQIQTGLQKDGDYKGNIDGQWGPETKSALQAYQQSHNLTADGQLDTATMNSLKLTDNSATAPMPSTPPASTPANPSVGSSGTTTPPPGNTAQ